MRGMIFAAALAFVAAPSAAQTQGQPAQPSQSAPSGAMPSPSGTLKKGLSPGLSTLGYRQGSVPFSSRPAPAAKPGGYSIDLCLNVVEHLKSEYGKAIEVRWQPVTIENRFRMLTGGRIDLECGSTTNTLGRRKIVDFSILTFVAGTTLLYRTDRGLNGS